MPERIKDVRPPRGLSRLAFRLPLWLYRLGLGSLLGKRFVCLTHTGRRSGKPRQTMLEVVRYDRDSGACIVAAGFGEGSDWVRNVEHDPHILFTIGRIHHTGLAERLDPETAADELVDYARRYPLAWRELVRFMGYRLDGTQADIHSLGKLIPMYIFKPILMVKGDKG
jgi:deazaflavin-dependent oxidoreductase (nitroreductase family)